jgi:hypothetical protein
MKTNKHYESSSHSHAKQEHRREPTLSLLHGFEHGQGNIVAAVVEALALADLCAVAGEHLRMNMGKY